MGQTIRVTKVLPYDNTSSVTKNFYNEFYDVPQKEKTCSISYSQINNFNSERFLKTIERMQKEINESTIIGTPDDFMGTVKQLYKTQRLLRLIKRR